ncbi:MAG: cyclopropane-fatty-acyl-phospholipid synthase family protein, partial [Burkholderiales bacterium]
MKTSTFSVTGSAQGHHRASRAFGVFGLASLGRAALRPLLDRLLKRWLAQVQHGTVLVTLPDGRTLEGRGPLPGPQAALHLHRWRALARLALGGDLGLAEAYRDGDWTTPDLTALLLFGCHNEAAFGANLAPSWPKRLASRLVHRLRDNTRRGSRRNIAAHYDLGNDFYARWLDPALIYSSALYPDDDASGTTLEQAQAAKLQRIIELLDLPGLGADGSVLEIGCGWGALALAIAQQAAVPVHGITLSREQLAHAQQRVRDEGRAMQIDLRLQDYRDLQGTHERIVSIEMFEAVGERHWPQYFDTLRRSLRPDGVAVLQVITIDEAHFDHYRREPDFIQRYIFPGGMLPSVTALGEQA